MRKKTKRIVAAGVVAAAAIGTGVGVVSATASDDDGTEVPVTGAAYDRATTAALEHTGGGAVSGTEAGDEEGAYEIEVTLENGKQVDVHLDEDFNVISEIPDNDSDQGDTD